MRLISIDIGLNNFVTVTNNIKKEPILIRGKIIKAENQWYNKITTPIRKQLDIEKDINARNKLQDNINRMAAKTLEHILKYFENVSEYLMQYCVDNRIDTVIIGKYKILEKENFISIPYDTFYSLLKTKCCYYGIKFSIINERFTSGTSFFDNEPTEKEYYDKSRRVFKHLWKCNNGDLVNADVNDSYQIMRKAYPKLFKEGVDGFLKNPIVVDIRI